MTEWLILLLLVPAIVAPAVLLVGFAGCSFEGSGVAADPSPITISSVVGTAETTIVVSWSFDVPGSQSANFERRKVSDSTTIPFNTTVMPHPDTMGLERATRYEYRAQGVRSDLMTSEWSDWVAGETLGFAILPLVTQNGSFGSADTNTIKCEIAVDDLTAPSFVPARMWITLGQWDMATRDIIFSKVYVGHKAAAGDPWDATPPLTQILFGSMPSIVITPGDTARSDQIDFAWDRTSALILSMYFAGGPTSDQLTARTTGSSDTHLKNGVDEAATADATGYTSGPGTGYLSGVVRIEVAE